MTYYGQWDPPVDKFIHENYFPDKEGGVFIECGALDGHLECSCRFFEESMGWEAINIEPVPYLFKSLCENRPDAINVRAALSNKKGKATFTQAISPAMGKRFGNGSLTHTQQHKQSLQREGCTFEKYVVDTMTYKDLVKEVGIDHLDLFVLDVEGHEIQVLEGMRGCKILPDLFCIEHGHIGHEIDKHLTRMGYRKDKTSFNNSFYVSIGSDLDS